MKELPENTALLLCELGSDGTPSLVHALLRGTAVVLGGSDTCDVEVQGVPEGFKAAICVEERGGPATVTLQEVGAQSVVLMKKGQDMQRPRDCLIMNHDEVLQVGSSSRDSVVELAFKKVDDLNKMLDAGVKISTKTKSSHKCSKSRSRDHKGLGKTNENNKPGTHNEKAKSKSTGVLRNALEWVTFNNAVLVAFFAYAVIAGSTFKSMLSPAGNLVYTTEDGRALPTRDPLWEEGTEFGARAFLSLKPGQVGKNDDVLWDSGGEDSLVFLSEFVNGADLILRRGDNMDDRIRESLEKNGTVFCNICLKSKRSVKERCVSSSMVKFLQLPEPKNERYLVKGWPIIGAFVPEEDDVVPGKPASGSNTTIGFWKPVCGAYMVADWTRWPIQSTPTTVWYNLPMQDSKRYLPVVYTDQLGLTREKLVQVNTTIQEIPLRIEVSTISVARWQFNAHMEQSFKLQRQIGATEKDIDDLRLLMTETEPVLLIVTLVVSLLHIMLDILAFRSDISFWSNVKTTKGLSIKTLIADLVSQIIITAYLSEQSASILVLAPSFVGVAIQIWKVNRARGLDAGDTTTNFDSVATRRVGLLLMPLVLGYSLYSLVRNKHATFYAWIIESLASSVYAFGFAMMLPQIFINYKLKSVAHLPWRFFIYKALNTFIDDLFAFIIRMPTMHRAACFRDDVVFFIYMYQRYIYPVDHARKEKED